MVNDDTKSKRIYVCHTLYHVLVSLMKEMNLPLSERGGCDIALSTVFMDFGDLGDRLLKTDVVSNVYALNEKRADDFPEVAKYKVNHHNIIKHTINRMKFTKKLGKLQDRFIDIDFKKYDDIYVYCDSDPIGYYLNYHHIYYHAVEDGLDCLKNFDAAHYDNAGHFKIKAFLAARNLIFIQNGYSKYCLDMEINDDSFFDYKFKKYKVVPRKKLENGISKEDKKQLLDVFLPDSDKIVSQLHGYDNCILFLTEGFPSDNEEVRINVANEILKDYCGINIEKDASVDNSGPHVVIKPHPRDDVDYEKLYPMCSVIRGKFPIEVLNFIDGIHFAKAVSIITSALDTIEFCDEKVNIGPHIYDLYEPLEKHAFMLEAWDKNNNDKKNK